MEHSFIWFFLWQVLNLHFHCTVFVLENRNFFFSLVWMEFHVTNIWKLSCNTKKKLIGEYLNALSWLCCIHATRSTMATRLFFCLFIWFNFKTYNKWMHFLPMCWYFEVKVLPDSKHLLEILQNSNLGTVNTTIARIWNLVYLN